MSKCIDPGIGDMLHAYELDQLPDDKKEIFELHLMDCAHCFEEVRKFERVSDMIVGDKDIKAAVKSELAKDMRKSRSAFWSRVAGLFWPKTQFILKPAITYFVILLLAYPAYLGIRGSKDGDIRQVVPLNLVPDRASSASIEQSGSDILLAFVFNGIDPERFYAVEIKSADGRVIYQNHRFSGFDRYEVGRLILPAEKIKKGEYILTIQNPQNIEVTQEYRFNVE